MIMRDFQNIKNIYVVMYIIVKIKTITRIFFEFKVNCFGSIGGNLHLFMLRILNGFSHGELVSVSIEFSPYVVLLNKMAIS